MVVLSEVQDLVNQYKTLDSLLIGAALTGLFLWWRSARDKSSRIVVPTPLSKPVSIPIPLKGFSHQIMVILTSHFIL